MKTNLYIELKKPQNERELWLVLLTCLRWYLTLHLASWNTDLNSGRVHHNSRNSICMLLAISWMVLPHMHLYMVTLLAPKCGRIHPASPYLCADSVLNHLPEMTYFRELNSVRIAVWRCILCVYGNNTKVVLKRHGNIILIWHSLYTGLFARIIRIPQTQKFISIS